MAPYQLIDEPQTKSWGDRVIVHPLIILLAAVIVPLFWNPPAFGRYWLPLIWLTVNGIALGSTTLKKELWIMWAGGAALAIAFFGAIFGMAFLFPEIPAAMTGKYVGILHIGAYFLLLYLVVANQQMSYDLYAYLRDKHSA